MMTAHEVIEAYVRDVARYLPREKRNDVAFELRGLLHDELTAKAAAEGREADREMVMGLLAGFGRPADAAARYHPRPPLIDPADNPDFLIWAVVGAIFFSVVRRHDDHAPLQWVGIVFLYFVLVAWFRRRQPSPRLRWRPKRDPLPEVGGRAVALLCGVATLVFPFAMYLAPQTWWGIASFGKSPTSGLALTDAFLHSWVRVVTLAALGLVVAIYLIAAAQGGWRAWSRRALLVANFLVGSMFVLHAAPIVTIFESSVTNRIAMPIFGAVGAMTLLLTLYAAYTEWARVSPAPAYV